MKNYAQVYVKNSIEAAQMYCKAFGSFAHESDALTVLLVKYAK